MPFFWQALILVGVPVGLAFISGWRRPARTEDFKPGQVAAFAFFVFPVAVPLLAFILDLLF